MRCPKCGYFSFDYLTECGKCGIGLVEVKEKLGMIGVKPAVPFFLGSLLKDGAQPEGAADDWESPGPAPEGGLSEIEFGEDFELDIGPPTEAAVPSGEVLAETESEFSLFDLGVPELQKEIHGEQTGDRKVPPEMNLALGIEPVITIPPLFSDASAGDRGASQSSSRKEPDEGLMFDLSAEDFAEQTEIQSGRPGSGEQTERGSVTPGDKVPVEPTDEFPHDLVIELDDEDPDRTGEEMGGPAAASAAIQDLPALEMTEELPRGYSIDFGEKDFAPQRGGVGEEMSHGGVRESAPVSWDRDEVDLELDDGDSSPAVGIKEEQKPLEPDAPAAAGGSSVPPEPAAMRSVATGAGTAAAADDMVIELSDDDLETLLTELEGISGGEGKKADKASTSTPQKKE